MIGSGRRIRTCRDLINSQAHPPRAVDRNKLVDRLGVEPSASCLQGISPPRRPAQRKRVHARLLENGARTWFRATLSCSSGRRFHQISFPSVRPARIELASSEWHSEALPIDQGRMVGNRGIEPRVPKAQVLQTRSVTRLGITRIWLQGSELNRLCLSASAYEADQRPVLVPASFGGCPTCRSPHPCECRPASNGRRRPLRLSILCGGRPRSRSAALARPIRFQRMPAARPVDLPNWTSRQESNLRSTRVRSAELFL